MQDSLDKNIQETNRLLETLIKRTNLWYRFVAGLMQALGATVGLAIILAILSYLLSRVQLVPIIGNWISDIANQALSNINFP